MNPIYHGDATACITWDLKDASSYDYWLHFRDHRDTEGPFPSLKDAQAYALDIGETICGCVQRGTFAVGRKGAR
jgi:hypothetical protein